MLPRSALTQSPKILRFDDALCQQLVDHSGWQNAGQTLIKSLILEVESFVVVAKLIHDGCVEVANVNGITDDIIAEVVSFAVDCAAFETTAGHPHGEAAWMMVAAVIRL